MEIDSTQAYNWAAKADISKAFAGFAAIDKWQQTINTAQNIQNQLRSAAFRDPLATDEW